MHEGTARFSCPDKTTARAVATAMSVEAGPPGATVSTSVEGTTVVLHIVAEGLGHLRAALVGNLRLLDAALAVCPKS